MWGFDVFLVVHDCKLIVLESVNDYLRKTVRRLIDNEYNYMQPYIKPEMQFFLKWTIENHR